MSAPTEPGEISQCKPGLSWSGLKPVHVTPSLGSGCSVSRVLLKVRPKRLLRILHFLPKSYCTSRMLSLLRNELNLLFQSDLLLVTISHTPTYYGCAAPFPVCSQHYQPFPALLFTTLGKAAALVSFRCSKSWFSHRGSICHLTFELERDNSAGGHRARVNLV